MKRILIWAMPFIGAMFGCSSAAPPPSQEQVKEVQQPVDDMVTKMKGLKNAPKPSAK